MSVGSRSIGFKSALCHIGSIFITLSLSCGNAVAETKETDFPAFSLRGFGTVGLAHSSESKADFIAHDLQAKGAGHSRDWSPDVDSRVGVQLDAKFTQQLSAVVQVMSEQRYDGSYRPRLCKNAVFM